MFKPLILSLAFLMCATALAEPAPHESIKHDALGLRRLAEPSISPDGKWLAYTVSQADVEKDKAVTDLWMSESAGQRHLRLTHTGDVGGRPSWSPSGEWLTFLAARGTPEQVKKGAQIWRLARAGGEAEQITDIKGGIDDYAWSPDGMRLVLVVADPDPREDPEQMAGWKRKTAPPIVIDRFRFKVDRDGYLGPQQKHLFLFELAGAKLTPLTSGIFSETLPTWSPDGQSIAFLSNRAAERDRTEATSLFVMEALPGATARQLATFTTDEEARPAWAPDGRSIAVLSGDEVRFTAYQQHRLTLIDVATGARRVLGQALDRSIQSVFAWAPDGRSLYAVTDDDRSAVLLRVDAANGTVQRLSPAGATVRHPTLSNDGRLAVLSGNSRQPPEAAVLTADRLQPISHHNDAWVASLKLGSTRDFTSISRDGTEVHGLVTLPPSHDASRRYPTVLLIHGGPNGQDAHEFGSFNSLLCQRLASAGYVVLQANYRGSSGRGQAFQRAIYADWGNKEVQDLLGAVDWAVRQGLADPARLGIGGWSYGGILTNYTIASDKRFKAAVSGAGSANQISMFGSDQYAVQYEREIGAPWLEQERWIKLSYPFFKANRISTPTLFLGGEKDFNVPIAGGEQMYLALKMLGVPTQLVVYPGQFHGITVPSYQRDVEERFIAWFDRFLKP